MRRIEATRVRAGLKRRIGVVLLALSLSASLAPASTTLYLHGDSHPLASLDDECPTASVLANYDPDRDGYPGLLLARGGSGAGETDPGKYQQWIGPPDGFAVDGPMSLLFWSAMKDFGTGKRGFVEAFLLDCDAFASDCNLIAEGHRDISDWSGGWGSWSKHSIEFGHVTQVGGDGRSLSVKIVVGADSDDDMWFAYDAAGFPSRLSDDSSSNIVIDGDFSDWDRADPTRIEVFDQGGPDDWSSPARLDITEFAVSSNLIDTFYLLIGFDDVSPQNTTAATLVDLDFDSNVDLALVATLDGEAANVELFSCDDTITFGCEGATLRRSYPPSSFRTGAALGPWNEDSLLEIALPFNDLVSAGESIVFTSLVSYASSALLTSPKDAVLGSSGQNYGDGIQYSTSDGNGHLVGPLGSDFLIRRHSDPSQVRNTDAHATVGLSPFDDSPGTRTDDQNYFYVVEKVGGLAVKLSAHANRYDDSVRIGFDDHDALSAPVDASLSDVTTDRSALPADGTTFATVTVVPRDHHGIPIGSGCSLGVDSIQLSPGALAGPIEDNNDGSYTARVVSTTPGTGSVVVSVEGITLTTQPDINFF
jgi:hypothetical protein